MDPLSITCGILAIGSAIIASLDVLSTVLGTMDEATALINELMDLRAVLNDLRIILEDSGTVETGGLASALSKLKDTTILLRDFIGTRLLKEDDFESIRISKLVWLRERNHITRYQRDLKTLRAELNTALNVANL